MLVVPMRPPAFLKDPTFLWAWGVDEHGLAHILIPHLQAHMIYVPWCEGSGSNTHLEFLLNPTVPTCLWCFHNVRK